MTSGLEEDNPLKSRSQAVNHWFYPLEELLLFRHSKDMVIKRNGIILSPSDNFLIVWGIHFL